MMTGIVDTHSHILPSVDDGARDMRETLVVVGAAADAGIRHMCATPHMWSPESFLSAEALAGVVERTNKALQEEGVPVTVYSGAEILCTEELLTCDPELLEVGVLGGSGRHILIEFPFSHVPECADRVVERLRDLDLIPVLAHMERNHDVQADVDVARRFQEAGCLIQMDAASLTGDLGGGSLHSSWELLEAGAVFCVASDVHFLDPRITSFDRAVRDVASRFGEQSARELFIDLPSKVLS